MTEGEPNLSIKTDRLAGRFIYDLLRRAYAEIFYISLKAGFVKPEVSIRYISVSRVGVNLEQTLGYRRTLYASPETLRKTLQLLNKYFRPETFKLLLNGAWAEHYRVVAPMCIDLQIPATILLPTAYIGSTNLPWIEKTRLLLGKLVVEQIPLPELTALNEKANGTIQSLREDRTEQNLFLENLLNNSYPAAREGILEELLSLYNEKVGAFDSKSLMTWKECRDLQERGIKFASLGHKLGDSGNVGMDELLADYRVSAQEFGRQGVDFSSFVAVQTLSPMLDKNEFRERLGVAEVIILKGEEKEKNIIRITEEDSSSEAMLACQLLGQKFFGEKY